MFITVSTAALTTIYISSFYLILISIHISQLNHIITITITITISYCSVPYRTKHIFSEKWNESLSGKNGSSVHGLLTDADSIDDDMELVDLHKKSESGVEVSFNGNK